MSDETPITTATPVSNEGSGVAFPSTTLDVVLPSTGEKKTIKKLKAGKYYQAQKIFADYLQGLRSILEKVELDYTKVRKEDGTPDTEAIALQMDEGKNSKAMSAMIENAKDTGTKKMAIVAICLDESLESVQENYYTEDVEFLFNAVSKLNDFAGNLTKSAAL